VSAFATFLISIYRQNRHLVNTKTDIYLPT